MPPIFSSGIETLKQLSSRTVAQLRNIMIGSSIRRFLQRSRGRIVIIVTTMLKRCRRVRNPVIGVRPLRLADEDEVVALRARVKEVKTYGHFAREEVKNLPPEVWEEVCEYLDPANARVMADLLGGGWARHISHKLITSDWAESLELGGSRANVRDFDGVVILYILSLTELWASIDSINIEFDRLALDDHLRVLQILIESMSNFKNRPISHLGLHNPCVEEEKIIQLLYEVVAISHLTITYDASVSEPPNIVAPRFPFQVPASTIPSFVTYLTLNLEANHHESIPFLIYTINSLPLQTLQANMSEMLADLWCNISPSSLKRLLLKPESHVTSVQLSMELIAGLLIRIPELSELYMDGAIFVPDDWEPVPFTSGVDLITTYAAGHEVIGQLIIGSPKIELIFGGVLLWSESIQDAFQAYSSPNGLAIKVIRRPLWLLPFDPRPLEIDSIRVFTVDLCCDCKADMLWPDVLVWFCILPSITAMAIFLNFTETAETFVEILSRRGIHCNWQSEPYGAVVTIRREDFAQGQLYFAELVKLFSREL